MIYAADLYRDSIVAINAESGAWSIPFKTGRRPYRILFHPDGKSFFVSSWSDGTVYLHDAATGEQTGPHAPGPAHHRHGAEQSQAG